MNNDEILVDFLEESYDLIEKVKFALSSWEAVENKGDLVNDVYRWVHTIKGGSAVFNFSNTARVAHDLESKLGEWRKRADTITAEDLVHVAVEIDKIEHLLRNADAEPALRPEKASGFSTVYFQDFYEDSRGIIEDMIKDGFAFLELVVPKSIADKVRPKLEDKGIFSLQRKMPIVRR